MTSLIEEFLNAKKSTPTTSSTSKQKPSEYKIDDFLQSLLLEEKKEQKEEISKKKQQEEEPSTVFHLTPYRIRELKKQKKMLKLVRQEMLQLIEQKKEAFMLWNTLEYFDSHLKYFVLHPLEFQRLWFQLPHKTYQKLFLQIVYLYYYADIILLRHETQNSVEQEELDWIPYKQQDPLFIQTWLQYEYQNHNNKNTSQVSLPVEEKKVQKIIRLIQSQQANSKFILLPSSQQQLLFYNEEELYQLQLQHSMVNHYLLQCNSKEIFLIESLLFQQ